MSRVSIRGCCRDTANCFAMPSELREADYERALTRGLESVVGGLLFADRAPRASHPDAGPASHPEAGSASHPEARSAERIALAPRRLRCGFRLVGRELSLERECRESARMHANRAPRGDAAASRR